MGYKVNHCDSNGTCCERFRGLSDFLQIGCLQSASCSPRTLSQEEDDDGKIGYRARLEIHFAICEKFVNSTAGEQTRWVGRCIGNAWMLKAGPRNHRLAFV